MVVADTAAVATVAVTVVAVAVVALAADPLTEHHEQSPPMRALFFAWSFMRPSIAHEQGHQRIRADLAAPVAMHRSVKSGPFGQRVG